MNSQENVRDAVDKMRSKLSSQQAEDLRRMYSAVCGFDEFLGRFDVPKAQKLIQFQDGRFLVDIGSRYFPHRQLLLLNGSKVVDRASWDYADYCSAMAAIPAIYSSLTLFDDHNVVNMLMAERLVEYLQPSE